MEEQEGLVYDVRKISYGKVVNSIARHNICFADFDQESDIPAGKGTVVNFASLPHLNNLRNALPDYLGDLSENLYAEGNKYYDIKKCGIGYHGDVERRIVIGTRLGSPMNLSYLWFHQSKPIGEKVTIKLEHGDMYIMSDEAVGYNWKKKLTPRLRHAAGCEKYTKIPE